MEFTALAEDITAEVALAQSVVERKTTIPVLGFIKLEAGTDGFVRMTATDLEVGLISKFVADVDEPGEILIPSDRFYQYLSRVPNGANFRVKKSNNGIHFKWEKSTGRFPIGRDEDFPSLPEPTSEPINLPASEFINALPSVDFAISKEDTRFFVAGMLLHIKGDSFVVTATDGIEQSLSSHSISDYSGKEIKIIIPIKAVSALKKIFGKDDLAEPIRFYHESNHAFFEYGNRVLYFRAIQHRYPEYMRVFPSGNLDVAELESSDLKDAIERIALFADDRSKCIRFEFNSDSLVLSASQYGDSTESVEIAYNGNPQDVGFKADYVLDFLRVASGKKIKLMLNSGAIMEGRIIGDDSYRFALAKMNLQQ